MNPVKVGVLGLGTVGSGTVNVLSRNRDEISRRAGRGIHVSKALVRDRTRSRSCDTSQIDLSTDPTAVVDDPELSVVVELMGGSIVTARDACRQAA